MPIVATYPNQVAQFATKFDFTDVVFAAHINALQAEVSAIEQIIGTLPQGTSSTVKDRIAAVESAVNTLSARWGAGGLMPESGVANLLTDLANRSLVGHSHVWSNITDIDSAVVSGASYVKNDASWMRMHWAGQGGQPSWLWGGNDPDNQYVYNPSNFNVNHASSADNAGYATNAGHASSADGAPWGGISGRPLSSINGGVPTVNFSGGTFTQPHGLGFQPRSAVVSVVTGGPQGVVVVLNGPTSMDGNNIYVRAMNAANSTNYSGTLTFSWIAFG